MSESVQTLTSLEKIQVISPVVLAISWYFQLQNALAVHSVSQSAVVPVLFLQ